MEIKWTKWDRTGHISRGFASFGEIEHKLHENAKEAKGYIAETKANHILYAIKKFDEDDGLSEVNFYMMPLKETEFAKLILPLKNAQVYAIHNRKGESKWH